MPTQPPIEPRLNPKPPAATDSRSVKAVALATVLLTAIGAAAAIVLHSELQSISATMSTQGETLQRHERRISRIGEKLGSSNRSLRTLVDQADTHERIRERHAAREAEQIRAMLHQLRRLGGSLELFNSTSGGAALDQLAADVKKDVAAGLQALRAANQARAEAARLSRLVKAKAADGTTSTSEEAAPTMAGGKSRGGSKGGDETAEALAGAATESGEASGAADDDPEADKGRKGKGKKGRKGRGRG